MCLISPGYILGAQKPYTYTGPQGGLPPPRTPPQRGQIIAAPRGPGAALRAAPGVLYNPGLFAVGSGGEAAAPPGTGICIWFLGPYSELGENRKGYSGTCQGNWGKTDECL